MKNLIKLINTFKVASFLAILVAVFTAYSTFFTKEMLWIPTVTIASWLLFMSLTLFFRSISTEFKEMFEAP